MLLAAPRSVWLAAPRSVWLAASRSVWLAAPRSVWLAAALAGVFAFGVAGSDAAAKVRSGDRAAKLSGVKDKRGKRVRVKAYRGKWLVMTFGASWCKPCSKELPALEKLAKKMAGQKLAFLAVNIDKSIATGKKFAKRSGLHKVRVGYDPAGNSVDTYDPPTMPTTYIIGPRGVVRYMHKGYRSGDDKKLKKKLLKFMSK